MIWFGSEIRLTKGYSALTGHDFFTVQVLLDLARTIFEEQSTLHNIVHKIMMITQSLLQCERCSVLLVDPTSKVINSKVSSPQAQLRKKWHKYCFHVMSHDHKIPLNSRCNFFDSRNGYSSVMLVKLPIFGFLVVVVQKFQYFQIYN